MSKMINVNFWWFRFFLIRLGYLRLSFILEIWKNVQNETTIKHFSVGSTIVNSLAMIGGSKSKSRLTSYNFVQLLVSTN